MTHHEQITALALTIAQQQRRIQELENEVETWKSQDALSIRNLREQLEESDKLRRAAKRVIAAGTTRGLRRKLQQVFDSVMGEETKCPF